MQGEHFLRREACFSKRRAFPALMPLKRADRWIVSNQKDFVMIFDVVVVGSGIAGSVAAYYLAKNGFSVAIMSKAPILEESNTLYAQGGIVYKGRKDSGDLIYRDIMQAGGGISLPDAVKWLAENGQNAVEETLIQEFGVRFSKSRRGGYDLTEEAAHSAKRILHSFDSTGKMIEDKAAAAIRKCENITLLTNYTAVDIITLDHHSTDKYRMYQPLTSLGIYALSNKDKKVEKILSKIVVLATGGMGQIYLHTTNPLLATGDGYAMASRAGARLVNMEYTQFHPTTLYYPKANNFLISEAVRGEGAVIVDKNGRAFMEKYHPQRDLAPRDIVTRAILNEMLESGEKSVYLDIAGIGENKIRSRFPNIYKKCLEFGLNITEYPVPIVPAFHFSCGGILTNLYGRTNINRLFAAGEVACTGLHGANRLASTSLLEGLVFGRQIADFITEHREHYLNLEFPEVLDWIDTGNEDMIDPALINQDWNLLKNMMWNYVGAVRNKKRLRRAIIDLNNLKEDVENFYRDAKVNKSILELRNAVQTGLIVARQALANRESIGAHYRTD
jgi:L-aspartate oxidase